MFRIGQKVVCVNNRGIKRAAPLTLNAVYTVREVYADGKNGTGLLLEEVVSDIHPIVGEFGYLPHRFRPVAERKTDISIFKAMLTPQGVDA